MPVEIYTMSEKEQDVIEAAIIYRDQVKNGLYRDVPKFRRQLFEAVDRLVFEHERRWEPQLLYDHERR